MAKEAQEAMQVWCAAATALSVRDLRRSVEKEYWETNVFRLLHTAEPLYFELPSAWQCRQ